MKRRIKCHYKKRTKHIGRGKPYSKGNRICFGNGNRGGFLLHKALASFVPQIIGSLIN